MGFRRKWTVSMKYNSFVNTQNEKKCWKLYNHYYNFLFSIIQDTLDAIIPTKQEMLPTVKIMKVLTLRLTKSLGDYEKKYLDAMDNDGRGFVNL